MRQLVSIIVCVLLASLSFLGCARDGASLSPEKRAEIQSKMRGRSNSSGQPSVRTTPEVRLGSFGIAGFLMDQQALLMQVALTAQKPEASFLGGMKVVFSTGEESQIQVKTVELQLNSKPQAQYVQKENMTWNLQSVIRDGELVYLRGVLDAAQLTLDLSKKPNDPKQRFFINQFPESSSVQARRQGEVTTLLLRTSGEMILAKDGVTERSPYSLRVQLQVKSLADQSELEILSSELFFELKRTRPFVVRARSENSLKYLNSSCPMVVGTINIENSSRPGDKNAVRIYRQSEEISMVEETGWKTAVSPCAERPLVDSSKILIY